MARDEAAPDPLRDWMDLWRSEIQAMAGDRELAERWRRLFTPPDAGEPGATPWSASAFPAPFGRDAELERLRERLDALERRVAQLEGGC